MYRNALTGGLPWPCNFRRKINFGAPIQVLNFIEGNSPKILLKTLSKLLKWLLGYKGSKNWTFCWTTWRVVIHVAGSDVISIHTMACDCTACDYKPSASLFMLHLPLASILSLWCLPASWCFSYQMVYAWHGMTALAFSCTLCWTTYLLSAHANEQCDGAMTSC